jgi:hypothetical protein
MYGQYDRHDENEAGQEREQQRGQHRRAVIGDERGKSELEPVSKGYCTRDGCMIHGIICN